MQQHYLVFCMTQADGDESDGTPLFFAACEGQVDAILALLGKGAEVNLGTVSAKYYGSMIVFLSSTFILNKEGPVAMVCEAIA